MSNISTSTTTTTLNAQTLAYTADSGLEITTSDGTTVGNPTVTFDDVVSTPGMGTTSPNDRTHLHSTTQQQNIINNEEYSSLVEINLANIEINNNITGM